LNRQDAKAAKKGQDILNRSDAERNNYSSSVLNLLLLATWQFNEFILSLAALTFRATIF